MQLTPYSTLQGFGSAKIFIDAKLNSMKAIKSAQSFTSSLFDDDKANMIDAFVPNFYCYFVSYYWSKYGDNPTSIIFLNFKRLKKDVGVPPAGMTRFQPLQGIARFYYSAFPFGCS